MFNDNFNYEMSSYIVRNSHVSIYTFNLIWGMILMMIDYSTFIVKKNDILKQINKMENMYNDNDLQCEVLSLLPIR